MEKPRLLDQVRARARLRHLSLRTEAAYISCIKRFILYHEKRHPREMGVDEIRAYLSYLAIERNVAASTQNVAFNALLFLYRDVLEIELPRIDRFERARVPKRLPVVFTREETRQVLAQLAGTNKLIAGLLYGAGLRLMDALRLRVKDVDFAQRQITIREGKGSTDRITMLPQSLTVELQHQLAKVKLLHEEELREGYGEVFLPGALATKYPAAAREWQWQYVFPASTRSVDPRSGIVRRHHLSETVVQRAVAKAIRQAAVPKHGVAILSATRLRRTCWKTDMTSEQFKSY